MASPSAELTPPGRGLWLQARVLCLAWSPSSRLLASGSLDSSIILWDTQKEATARVALPLAHREGVHALVFAAEETLVSAGADCCLRVWRLGA